MSMEEKYKNVFIKGEDDIYRLDMNKILENARVRTRNRTSVEVIEEYNPSNPIVDWVLMEVQKDKERYYKLVCLIHFVVKVYRWELKFTWKENTIDWKWYKIKDLPNIPNIAPNAYIVCQEAIKLE